MKMKIILKNKELLLLKGKKAYSIAFTGVPNDELWDKLWWVKLKWRCWLFCLFEYGER
jgi:hypothetical protein